MPEISEKKGNWQRVKPFVMSHKKVLLLSLLIVPILSVLNLSQPYLVKVAIDNYILKNNLSGLRVITSQSPVNRVKVTPRGVLSK